jgi:hypothetical protein
LELITPAAVLRQQGAGVNGVLAEWNPVFKAKIKNQKVKSF